MLKARRAQFTKVLGLAYTVVTNIPLNDDAMSCLENNGFFPTKFDQGKLLYEKATISVGAEICDDEEIKGAEASILDFQKRIAVHYGEFVEAAKKSFGKDSLSLLGMGTALPHSRIASFEKAKISFARIREYPQLVKYLSGSGFGEEQIKSACEKIDMCSATMKQLDGLKKNSMRDIAECEIAMEKLSLWLVEFCEKWAVICIKDPKFQKIIEINCDDVDIAVHSKKNVKNSMSENIVLS